ncbi:MAG: hypothetical protein DBX47_04715 [Clostridiales bacterium]|nr:MAG: hypothetical protein DBX47_04715 [Clostridiales bacterium]
MNKRFLTAAPILILCLSFIFLCGFTAPAHSQNLYVTDNSGVISSEHSGEIVKYSAALKNSCGAEIAVLTVKTLGGVEPAEYATKTANEWKIGDKDKDNGVLILLATEDREIYVAVGSGLEGRLNDGKVGRLIDKYAIDYLSDNDFDGGIFSLYNVILSEVMAEYGIEELEGFTPQPEEDEDIPVWMIILILILVGASPIWFFPLFGRGRGGRGGRGGGFTGGFGGGGGGFSGGSFGGGGFSGGGAGRGF